jgi:hypothetical protein
MLFVLAFLVVFIASVSLLGFASRVRPVKGIVLKDTVAYVAMSICMFLLLLLSFYPESHTLPGTSILITVGYAFISVFMSITEFSWARQHSPRLCLSAA